MLLKVDHYTSLARAVARVDRDSYEARGAIYDRALSALVKRLNTALPPYSHADIEMELLAFREAVRRALNSAISRTRGSGSKTSGWRRRSSHQFCRGACRRTTLHRLGSPPPPFPTPPRPSPPCRSSSPTP